jgi:hypothetical protein
MAIDKVMHDADYAPIPEKQGQQLLTRGSPCLVCGEWIEPETTDAYRVLVSNPPREGEYACHERCLAQVAHPSVPLPS